MILLHLWHFGHGSDSRQQLAFKKETLILSRFLFLFPSAFRFFAGTGLSLQLPIQRKIHCDKTGQAADAVGDGFGPEHPVHSQAHAGQEYGQGRHNYGLTQQRKEHRVPGISQSRKSRLPGKLKRHEEKSEKIQFQRHGPRLQHDRIFREHRKQ